MTDSEADCEGLDGRDVVCYQRRAGILKRRLRGELRHTLHSDAGLQQRLGKRIGVVPARSWLTFGEVLSGRIDNP